MKGLFISTKITFIIVWFILIGLIGCAAEVDEPGKQAGTDTGNAIVMGLSIKGTDPAEPSNIEIEDAWMGLDSLTFYNCNDDAQAAVFNGPFAVDLSRDNALGDAEATSTAICSMDIRFHAYPQTDDMLSGRSLYLTGVSIEQLPFQVSIDRELIVTQNLEPIELTSGSNPVTLQFDPRIWMEGVDFNTAELTDGVVLIDEMHNQAILDSILQHMMQDMGMNHHMETSEMMEAMPSDDGNHMP